MAVFGPDEVVGVDRLAVMSLIHVDVPEKVLYALHGGADLDVQVSPIPERQVGAVRNHPLAGDEPAVMYRLLPAVCLRPPPVCRLWLVVPPDCLCSEGLREALAAAAVLHTGGVLIGGTTLVVHHGAAHHVVHLPKLLRQLRLRQLFGAGGIHIIGCSRAVFGPDDDEDVAVW